MVVFLQYRSVVFEDDVLGDIGVSVSGHRDVGSQIDLITSREEENAVLFLAANVGFGFLIVRDDLGGEGDLDQRSLRNDYSRGELEEINSVA